MLSAEESHIRDMYYMELDIELEHELCIDLPFELGNDINRFKEKQPYSLF